MKGLMKNLNPHFHKAIPTEEDCRRIKAQEAYYRPILTMILGEHFLELVKMFFKGDKMQEVMKDGSEGKTFVEDTIEELLPHIKKSLSDPKVKFVKVYQAKALIAVGINHLKKEDRFMAEEEKVETGKPFVPTEGMDKKKKSHLLYPITVLESERDSTFIFPKGQVEQLNKAIDILNNERYKLVGKEFKAEVEKKEKEK